MNHFKLIQSPKKKNIQQPLNPPEGKEERKKSENKK